MRKCTHCRSPIPKVKDCTDPYQEKGFCNKECKIEHGTQKALKALEKKKAADTREAKQKAAQERRERREAKKNVMTRSEWLGRLQDLVNQYVVRIRDVNEPCCTCGTTNPNIKYDAGHCFTRGGRSELRYELTNIHKQCSNSCNVQNSGRQAEHKVFIARRYGEDHLAKLEDRTQWESLKDRFPDWQSIEAEMMRWRKILRDYDIKPRW